MGWIADLLKEIPSAARYKAELELMEKENASLKADNSRLKADLESSRKELVARTAPAAALPDTKEKILVLVAHHENATASRISGALSVSKGIVDLHLEDLRRAKFIETRYTMGEEPEHYVEQDGRRYLHGKGLL